VQISEIPAQRKFVSAVCHAHFNAHKPQKIVGMNLDIWETIKDRELGSPILIP